MDRERSEFGVAFSFLAPSVSFGRGTASKAILGALDSLSLRRPLLVTGQGGIARHRADGSLSAEAFERLDALPCFRVPGEPTVDMATSAVQLADAARAL